MDRMVGWVSAVASNGFVELIAHPKTRSVPINLAVLITICLTSKLHIPVAIYKSSGRELEGEHRMSKLC
jgi:hypothetical protein